MAFSLLLVVRIAEFLETVSELNDSVLGRADDHAEEAIFKEALGREGEAVLLIQKLGAEVHVVADALELLEVDTHHHVHGGAAPDGSYTSDI